MLFILVFLIYILLKSDFIYIYNLNWDNFDFLANYQYIQIVMVFIIDLNFFMHDNKYNIII